MYSKKEVSNAHQRFAALIVQRYQMKCSRQEKEPTMEGLVLYLIGQYCIRWPNLIQYMVIELFPEYLYRCDGQKSKAVKVMEAELPVTDRTIWSTLNKIGRTRLMRKKHPY
jgi:hypothetical protein